VGHKEAGKDILSQHPASRAPQLLPLPAGANGKYNVSEHGTGAASSLSIGPQRLIPHRGRSWRARVVLGWGAGRRVGGGVGCGAGERLLVAQVAAAAGGAAQQLHAPAHTQQSTPETAGTTAQQQQWRWQASKME
jgi:hypothetical protein